MGAGLLLFRDGDGRAPLLLLALPGLFLGLLALAGLFFGLFPGVRGLFPGLFRRAFVGTGTLLRSAGLTCCRIPSDLRCSVEYQ
mmetsp:Transcript_34343/g.68698  ORF Transcript_34343/g.68698 Transcript_34343/m.68698 type:complete len:84 (-) Transcript_34343:99-350(-)